MIHLISYSFMRHHRGTIFLDKGALLIPHDTILTFALAAQISQGMVGGK
jgi:hypothetical protein